MKARQVMTKDVICVTPETSLKQAQQVMRRLRVRHVPVTSGGRLCGILSDRDLLLRGQVGSDGTFTVPDIPAGEAMSLCPVSCSQGTRVPALAELMLQHRIDSIPITGLGGDFVGLVTSTDLLELLTKPEQLSDELPFAFNVKLAEEARPSA